MVLVSLIQLTFGVADERSTSQSAGVFVVSLATYVTRASIYSKHQVIGEHVSQTRTTDYCTIRKQAVRHSSLTDPGNIFDRVRELSGVHRPFSTETTSSSRWPARQKSGSTRFSGEEVAPQGPSKQDTSLSSH